MRHTYTAVSYKGEEIDGIALPLSVNRIDRKIKERYFDMGFTCIGKQQFGNGLRICFIPNEDVSKPKIRELKKGEEWISGYKTNFDLKNDIDRAVKIIKECYKKDPSDRHKEWMFRTLTNNMGLNNMGNVEIRTILNNNWTKLV